LPPFKSEYKGHDIIQNPTSTQTRQGYIIQLQKKKYIPFKKGFTVGFATEIKIITLNGYEIKKCVDILIFKTKREFGEGEPDH
jgi:hypothetical protein